MLGRWRALHQTETLLERLRQLFVQLKRGGYRSVGLGASFSLLTPIGEDGVRVRIRRTPQYQTQRSGDAGGSGFEEHLPPNHHQEDNHVSTTRRGAKFAALVVGLSLIAAACGGDDEETTTATDAPATTEATEATEAPATTEAGGETTEAPGTTEAPADEALVAVDAERRARAREHTLDHVAIGPRDHLPVRPQAIGGTEQEGDRGALAVRSHQRYALK
jgi:hypothetical protein